MSRGSSGASKTFSRMKQHSDPVSIEDFLLEVIGSRQLRSAKLNVFETTFNHSTFIGNELELKQMLNDIYTNGDKPIYLGALQGRGMGKSTMCDEMRYLCEELKYLAVAVNFRKALEDDWSCVGSWLSTDVASNMKFALGLVSRMLHDRYEFESLGKVQELMGKEFHKVASMNQHSRAVELVEKALSLIRRRSAASQHDSRYDRVLVIIDETYHAVQAWPVSQGKRLLSVLTEATIHQRGKEGKDGVSLFVTGLMAEAFESDLTTSIMVPVKLGSLHPVDIRDKWLSLRFSNAIVQDIITRFLVVLAPIPRVISTMRVQLEDLASKRAGEVSTQKLGDLMNEASRVFNLYYETKGGDIIKYVTIDMLNGLLFGKTVMLSNGLLELMKASFFVNGIRLVNSVMEKNSVTPESALFVLKEIDLTGSSGPAKRVLGWLQEFARSVICDLTDVKQSGIEVAGRALEILYPKWLEVKINFLLQIEPETVSETCGFLLNSILIVCFAGN